ncbi:hypothetical protein EJ04DRAFT_502503 [Polyplosphaeria fusca]|uniref:Uncharacterized protein n=1 Tax=Polyplosphaeria fusca TaxID=682080 RepID=A0A9P4UWK0_9PLEO|nr:hypothetical protein EJ04DRAFT_502503 [Polyplosphaeria fusca]
MEHFQFVTLTHPDAVKNKANQNLIRAHVKRGSLLKSRQEDVKKGRQFIPSGQRPQERNSNTRRKKSRAESRVETRPELEKSPSLGQLDPFDCLPESPERLRQLMRHESAKQAGEPIFCLNSTGVFFFQNLETVFHGALSDPALFHALSLSLALAANGGLANAECLNHKGEILKEIGSRFSEETQDHKASTLSSILLLIGYEASLPLTYRIKDTNADAVEMHLRALEGLVKTYNESNIFFCDTLRRALFWIPSEQNFSRQDLISSFVIGSRRFLSHALLPELCYIRDPYREQFYVVPPGFMSVTATFPWDMLVVLEDLNALCALINARCMCGHVPINTVQIDNTQAWIESRLVDLLNEHKYTALNDPPFEACIYATYICTYQLSTSIWEGSFIPAFCTSQILRILQESENEMWFLWSELLTWLLYIGGAFATDKKIRVHFIASILGTYRNEVHELHKSWESLEELLMTFIWSRNAMSEKVRQFWDEVHPS